MPACLVHFSERCEPYIEESLDALIKLGQAPWNIRTANQLRYYRGNVALQKGDLRNAEALLSDVCQRNEALARESGAEYAFACWPLFGLGFIATLDGEDAHAVEHHQTALLLAWQFREWRCIAYSVAAIAGTLARNGRWEEAARLFGAVEAQCERTGVDFEEEMLKSERIAGLPKPWHLGDDVTWDTPLVQLAATVRRSRPLPPLPDPAQAGEIWAAGRLVSIEVAVEEALAVDLAIPARPFEHVPESGEAAMTALSPRERDVLMLVCERLTDPQIAERLFLSPCTVESHVSHILDKLGVENRRDAAAMAGRLGLA